MSRSLGKLSRFKDLINRVSEILTDEFQTVKTNLSRLEMKPVNQPQIRDWGLLPLKENDILETPPEICACGKFCLIQRVASIKSLP